MQPNRIYFKNNPFPGGHGINDFRWSGELHPEQGLIFHFLLVTADYDAEDTSGDAEEELPDWLSKVVWNNYHRCTIASKERGANGIPVSVPGRRYDFGDWGTRSFTADAVPLAADYDPDDLAFGIYLLGHDTCADHCIRITATGNGLFDIHWTGKIALTYAGEENFDHEFEAFINNVAFNGIYYPKGYTKEQALQLLEGIVANAGRFQFEDLNPKSFKREYKLVLP